MSISESIDDNVFKKHLDQTISQREATKGNQYTPLYIPIIVCVICTAENLLGRSGLIYTTETLDMRPIVVKSTFDTKSMKLKVDEVVDYYQTAFCGAFGKSYASVDDFMKGLINGIFSKPSLLTC